MQTQSTRSPILRDMGDGIIIRRATEADGASLVALETDVFDARAASDVRAVIDGDWPISKCDQFLIAEDTTTGQLVSSLSLLDKSCTYEGIPFGVGVVEWVLTRPEYRRKGLIRAQMDLVHQWSEARGDLMQIISGIPNYYRQFGYDMALELDTSRIGFTPYVPKLKDGETEPYRMRPATDDDIPFIVEVAAYARQRYAITNIEQPAYWAGMIRRGQSADPWRHVVTIIETPEGEAIGYLVHFGFIRREHQLLVEHFELRPGVSWLAVALPVTRYLCATGEEYAQREGKTFGTFNYWLGTNHPIYEVLHDLLPQQLPPYAWYVRIPDLLGFMRHIAPALEARLAQSVVVGHTGDLKLSFYRSGVRLVFEQGKLTTIEPWMPQPGEGNGGDAAFPELTFFQLLLGYRTLEEMEAIPDCLHEGDGARALLHALFPRRVSDVWL